MYILKNYHLFKLIWISQLLDKNLDYIEIIYRINNNLLSLIIDHSCWHLHCPIKKTKLTELFFNLLVHVCTNKTFS